MFESAEIEHRVDKETFREQVPLLRKALLDAQYDLKEKPDFPVVILIHGFDGAGRGDTMNLLNEWMDPRLIRTVAFDAPNDEARARPWMWRYWRELPGKGRIGIFFGSYYSDMLFGRVKGHSDWDAFDLQIQESRQFEHMLAQDGALVIKFWFHLSREKQKKRLKTLEKDPATRWRVTKTDWEHFEQYDLIRKYAEHMIRLTNTADAPWIIVDGEDANYRSLTVGNTVLNMLRARLAEQAEQGKTKPNAPPLMAPIDNKLILDALTLDQPTTRDDYRAQIDKLQGRLYHLTRHPRFAEHALMLAFEGNDAAGKGGAIRRITQALDARTYHVVPIAAPTEEERAQPWLWRFWRYVPAKGRITIFDRTWYGRVLVERVEGFASEPDWMRAYFEINDFEHQLSENGIIVIKFWLTISEEEQYARFKAREETGFKRFKITEEDWRNREKWEQYRLAVSDMVDRTSTTRIPWVLVEANNKYFARLKILETICETLEARLHTPS
ncbi:MAG: polyphosphate:AMP phosphotransferase [Paludibacterium sp.]|uniref:polyphosphate:AMP phosphotransferase n=1 Tax=Paludibacterium sp. TaxID=1917523 RepID=UPI0025F58B33|nr:polyphosphate:AMP phosphotransferase [Paludibacterium sp.]MBV8045591.1 polyphosphate:AMP phosphotransferase [Paludibacterium sp.]MBV8647585.1 polyphosphate:AMP phosphotransferase [Paludibacterium sp.]